MTDLLSEKLVTFTYPYTGTPVVTAEVNAPEFGDVFTQGRAQVIKRTRAGYSVAYDRGKKVDEEYIWEFRNIIDSQRSALKTFLDYVTWGASKILVTDWLGTERIVRVSQTSLTSKNARQLTLDGGQSEVLWDFSLTLLDVTNNPNEVGLQDTLNMSSALKIHIADQQDPHNLPAFAVLNTGTPVPIDNVDIETQQAYPLNPNITYYNKSVFWFVEIENDTQTIRGSAIVHATSDRDYDTPADAATVVALDVSWYENATDVSSIVTLDVVLVDIGGVQNLRLRGVLSAGADWKAQARRIKL